jgi:hypothetical protein
MLDKVLTGENVKVKSWDIPIWNVKTSKEIDEDITVFRSFKVFG